MNSERKIYSVAEVNRKARMVLESGIGEVWVEGELSRVTLHSSGHWYFTLKDAQASVSCAMFRNDNAKVPFKPKDGMKVQMLARPSLYEVSGRYQLIASAMEEAGKGSLQEQFEKLKKKLADEGLFDASRKKPLPVLPRKIGVVTSPTGAAIRDIINVLTRRFPNIGILLVPAKVQGVGAENGIAKAIDYLNSRGDIDVMIVGRGGGSIEDLWCFNEEIVARAIARSEVPVISAVGHEIDFTISDFVADVRAPTPSAAAELAIREKTDFETELALYRRRLGQNLKTMESNLRLRLNRAAHSYVFREPQNLLLRHRQNIQGLEAQMGSLLRFGVQQAQQRVDEIGMLLKHRTESRLAMDRQRTEKLAAQLRMLNPLAVLGRGYSLTYKADGRVVRRAHDLAAGERLTTRLAEGKVISTVEEIE
ncbi:MAG: exodeoxyribonuclease VII large subunit [Kiritimatiellales bacterium]|nr:exodeoxyribonuclease VII large subunit [Kiritimatiellales bacterium]